MTNHIKFIIGLLGILSSITVVAALTSQNPVLEAPVPAVQFPNALVGFSPSRICTNAITPHLRQSASYVSGDEGVAVKWIESDSSSPPQWYTSEVYESTTYRVTACCGRAGGNILYVAGISPDGSDVIERLNYGTRKGGYEVQIQSPAAQPIGTPMPAYSAQEALNGTTFAIPQTQHAPARRTVIYSGTAMGHVRSMDVDPEGRYLLVLGFWSGSVFQLDLTAPTITPAVLFSAAQLPQLAKARTLELCFHLTEGRKVELTESSGCVLPIDCKWMLLNDSNNDGVFESTVTLDRAAWLSSGYDEYSNWRSFQNLGVTFNW